MRVASSVIRDSKESTEVHQLRNTLYCLSIKRHKMNQTAPWDALVLATDLLDPEFPKARLLQVEIRSTRTTACFVLVVKCSRSYRKIKLTTCVINKAYNVRWIYWWFCEGEMFPCNEPGDLILIQSWRSPISLKQDSKINNFMNWTGTGFHKVGRTQLPKITTPLTGGSSTANSAYFLICKPKRTSC